MGSIGRSTYKQPTMLIRAREIPGNGLLSKYCYAPYPNGGRAYTDCFEIAVDGQRSLAEFVTGFYCSWLFKLERLVIRLLAGKPSTDNDVLQLAAGSVQTFAVWTLEERTPTQLLLCDDHGRTRSWLMVEPGSRNGQAHTMLRFGSAVTPETDAATNKTQLSMGFRLLLPVHRVYSRLLLGAGRSRLLRSAH